MAKVAVDVPPRGAPKFKIADPTWSAEECRQRHQRACKRLAALIWNSIETNPELWENSKVRATPTD